MKIIQGLSSAQKAFSRQRSLDLDTLSPSAQAKLRQAFGIEFKTATQAVEHILRLVREKGDDALREITLNLDNVSPDSFEVPPKDIKAAYSKVSPDLVKALQYAAQRIKAFHQASLPKSWSDPNQGYGQRVVPIQRVGAYAPGGRAPYPSTVLMTAIPARVAGVEEIILCTPASGKEGPSPSILVASDIAGVDRVFQLGGAQALAAMAYGTASVPRMDMLCGPGNIFVTVAKKLLYGTVGIDGLYGPTETVLVADEKANPSLCAADMLAQAEHDTMATPILVTNSRLLVKTVQQELEIQIVRLERKDVARTSLNERGHIVIVDTLEEAVEVANYFAPEHLCLLVENPQSLLGKVKNAGGVFMGEFSPEVMGDYTAGPSHTMPTGGTARFSSSLGVHSFIKFVPVVSLDRKSFAEQAPFVSAIGRAEGFTAHARAAEIRAEMLKGQIREGKPQ